jgi:DNA-binding CsgD family transcriptional regulator
MAAVAEKRRGRRRAPATAGGYRGTRHADRNRRIKELLAAGKSPEQLAVMYRLKADTIRWIDRYAQV